MGGADQPFFANQIKRLKVGTAQRFAKTTPENLRTALRRTLSAEVMTNIRAVPAADAGK